MKAILRVEAFHSSLIGYSGDPATLQSVEPAQSREDSAIGIAQKRRPLLGIALVIVLVLCLKLWIAREFGFEPSYQSLFFQARELFD
jgi:hypothetical protein